MSSQRSHRERSFSPLRDKTLANVLRHLFVTEFGYENKTLFADAMIQRILETLEAFVKPAALLRPGQMLWMAVANDGPKHAGRPMHALPQRPVILDLVTDEDLQALADGATFRTLRQRRHARLLDQTQQQDGALAFSDLSAITLTSETQVGTDVQQIQEAEERIMPHRGSVHDVGPTLSHKAEVARLLENGYLEPEICQALSPVHTLRSVERYAQTYKNTLKLLAHGFSPAAAAGILTISQRLMDEYLVLVKEHHPEILADNPHCQVGNL